MIDRRWATVGSSNIDPFSLLLAREANVVVDDEAFSAALRASLQAAMQGGAREVRAGDWHRRPLPARVAHWTCYGFARLLTGVFGLRPGARVRLSAPPGTALAAPSIEQRRRASVAASCFAVLLAPDCYVCVSAERTLSVFILLLWYVFGRRFPRPFFSLPG